MTPDDVRIPLREYLDEKFEEQSKWMLSTFATKEDVAAVREDVAVLKDRDANADRKIAGAWGGAGAILGGAIVTVLAYFGIGKQ